ncbi:MAG: DUF4013 domain-containing protein [Opitutaceae bacterium]
MPTLDQVSKRVFSDSSCLVKCLIGGLLCMVPVANLWALGVFYRMADQGRRGEPVSLPQWEDWGRLFMDGLQFLLIALVFGFCPIFVGWLLSLPLIPFLGPLARLLLIPGLILAAPLTLAGVYAYQRKEDFREAFNLGPLLRLLQLSAPGLAVPTLAFLGALAIGWVSLALMPFAFFIAGAIVSYFYGAVYRAVEIEARRVRRE